MPLTKSDIPELLLPGLKTEFELAYRAEVSDSIAEKLATVVNTSMPIQKYAWLGATPPMREFVDERRPSGLSAKAVTIEDKVFESSISVDRRAIEDDQLDLIRLRVRELANRVSAHRHQLVVDALIAGTSQASYDGAAFFSDSHPDHGGASASNLIDDALSAETLAAAISAMMGFSDEAGIPLGITPDTLVVGPTQMWSAIELVESPVVVHKGGIDGSGPTDYANAFQGILKVVVSPYVRGDAEDNWYLLDTKRPIKGIILQQREDVPVEFTALEAASGGESAWMRDRYHYGVRARYNTGYGLWQAALAGVPG